MTYEYVCTSCGNQWEAEQSISEAPLKDCPKCHASSAKRQVSGGAGFILKGGGWYADGYGSSSGSNSSKKSDSNGGSSSSGSSSSSSSPSGGESKSETKTESKGSATAAA